MERDIEFSCQEKVTKAKERLERARENIFHWSDYTADEIAQGIDKLGGGGTSIRIYFKMLSNFIGLFYFLSILAIPCIAVNSFGTGLTLKWNISNIEPLPFNATRDLSAFGITILQRARLQSSILNVCQGTHCRPGPLEPAAPALWSCLLVFSVLGFLIVLQLTSVQMEACANSSTHPGPDDSPQL